MRQIPKRIVQFWDSPKPPQEIEAVMGSWSAQPMIQMAFYQAVENQLSYTTEGPWFQAGPGLMTSCVSLGLVPYLSHLDYRMWPYRNTKRKTERSLVGAEAKR